jgi:hypothetical protein
MLLLQKMAVVDAVVKEMRRTDAVAVTVVETTHAHVR